MAKKSVKKNRAPKTRIKKTSSKNVKRTTAKTTSRNNIMKGVKINHLSRLIRTLLLFLVIFITSILLYNVAEEKMYMNLFFLIALLFGFAILAMLIVLLTIEFLKIIRNKR